MASVLLTGACGYVGASIGAALKRLGVAYDVLPGRLEQLAPRSLPGYGKVVHAAGAPRHRGQAATEQANHIGTKRLLAALGATSSVLFISSRLVYGHQPARTCTEADQAQPAEFYGCSKLAAEQAIQGSGLEHFILRVPGLIGDSAAGIGHNFLADALRRFLAGEETLRYLPDRLHDNLDVLAVAKLCADWVVDGAQLGQGITNVTGHQRSIHATLSEFAAVASQFGGSPAMRDQAAPDSPWPFMSDQRFRRNGGTLSTRSDTEIAIACCRQLLADSSLLRPRAPA